MRPVVNEKQKKASIRELMDEEGELRGYYFCWDDGRVVHRDKNTKIPFTTCYYYSAEGGLVYVNEY